MYETGPSRGPVPPQSPLPSSISGLNILLGGWLIIAPWVLGYAESNTAVANQVVLGIAVLLMASIRYVVPGLAVTSWANAAMGVWLIIAPFVLSYATGVDTTAIAWNDVVVGGAIAFVAVSSILSSTEPAQATARRHFWR